MCDESTKGNSNMVNLHLELPAVPDRRPIRIPEEELSSDQTGPKCLHPLHTRNYYWVSQVIIE
jgi:hypothetical protein